MSAARDTIASSTTFLMLLGVIGQVARAIAISSFVLGVAGTITKNHLLIVSSFVTCGISVLVMIAAVLLATARLGRLYKELDD